MEDEINEVALATNKDDKYEMILTPLNLANYNLGHVIKSNSLINLVHIKGKRVITSYKNVNYDHTDIQKLECVNGRMKKTNCWSFDEDWKWSIRKDQDYSGNIPIKNNDLVNLIHSTSNKSLYYDDSKRTKDFSQTFVACREFQDDLMGFQWYVQFVYSPYNDEILRSGTIVKLISGIGTLHSITNSEYFSNQDIFVYSENGDQTTLDEEDDFWLVVENIQA
jgi:hypothetical protein